MDSPLASQTLTRKARVMQAVDRCIEEKRHGDVLTRAELEAWFSIEFPNAATRSDYQRLDLLFAALKSDFDKELLTAHKMALESERGGRWRIVLPSEQSGLAAKTAREMFSRGLLKAQSIAANVEVASLTDGERAKLDDTSARLASIQMFAKTALRKGLPSKAEKA